jgi:ParB family transcriptional regulator, chromosome partitioning protein
MSKPTDNPRKALGKGLSALLPPRPRGALPTETTIQQSVSTNSLSPLDPRTLPIGAIQPNPDQPREDFDPVKLEELAQSIRVNGIIQPITVTHYKQGTYLIIAGERRWRAAQLAGLEAIPVYVREAEPEQVLELALIENIQRADLNAVETAHAFRQLIERYGLSHDQVAERTGKDRSTVTNFLRLLKLAAPVLEALASGRIAVGHARTLLNLPHPDSQWAACQRIIDGGFSVRETEAYVKKLTEPSKPPADPPAPTPIDPNIRAALDDIAMALGTKVRLVSRSESSGRLEIEYYSQEDLDRIYAVITASKP